MRHIAFVHGSASLIAYLKFRKYGHIIFYLNRNDKIYDRFVFDIIILFHQKFKLIKLQKIAKKVPSKNVPLIFGLILCVILSDERHLTLI